MNSVRIFGRTERAQIPGDLLSSIAEWATHGNLGYAFEVLVEDEDGNVRASYPQQVILFGEGIGKGIQGAAGQAYGEKRFVLFDVVVDGKWLRWSDVLSVAEKLGIETATEFAWNVPLERAKSFVFSSEFLSDSEHVEGVILRTDPYLFDAYGNRIMAKYKVRDLP